MFTSVYSELASSAPDAGSLAVCIAVALALGVVLALCCCARGRASRTLGSTWRSCRPSCAS